MDSNYRVDKTNSAENMKNAVSVLLVCFKSKTASHLAHITKDPVETEATCYKCGNSGNFGKLPFWLFFSSNRHKVKTELKIWTLRSPCIFQTCVYSLDTSKTSHNGHFIKLKHISATHEMTTHAHL